MGEQGSKVYCWSPKHSKLMNCEKGKGANLMYCGAYETRFLGTFFFMDYFGDQWYTLDTGLCEICDARGVPQPESKEAKGVVWHGRYLDVWIYGT